MSDTVKPKRRYNSDRRRQQAAATRLEILEAAQRLFERQGYAPTTMDAIATEAGVALKTVYSGFATKSGVLRAVWDLVVKGDVEDTPVAQRPWYRDVLDEPDPTRQLQLLAHFACIVKRRIGPMLRVIRSASAVDPDGAALWDLIGSDFYDNQHAIIATIDQRGGLRADLDPKQATDILWTFNHPDTWLLLVGDRGWSPEEFEAWFADVACDQLLAKRTRRAPRKRR